jgi:hypothetical protein
MRRCVLTCAVLTATFMVPSFKHANADVILLGEAQFSAQGFGNANRLITIQTNSSTETGAIFPVNGSISGTGDLASPLSDNQKFGIPTLGQLGWTSASQVQVLFNAAEPGGNSITLDNLTLSFFNGNDSIFSISNIAPITISDTNQGNGSAGFLFGISPGELSLLDSSVFSLANFSGPKIGHIGCPFGCRWWT